MKKHHSESDFGSMKLGHTGTVTRNTTKLPTNSTNFVSPLHLSPVPYVPPVATLEQFAAATVGSFASALNSVLIGLVHPLRSKPPGKSCCQTNAVTFRFNFCAQAVCKKCAVFSSKTYKIHDFLSSSTSSKHLTHFDARVKMKCFFLMAGFEDLRMRM